MTNINEDKPPVFSRWRSWYILLLVVLLVQIVLYYFLTLRYS